MSKSVYDVEIKSWDGQENFLSNYKGKVTLFINVTADCGNAPQYAVIEELYNKYKDQGFEVVAVPTNNYCGPNVTYGEWEYGISCANDAKSYAENTYGVTYQFTEMVDSRPTEGIAPMPPHGWPESSHELFELFNDLQDGKDIMGGNFEKYLVDKEGNLVAKFKNSDLLDFASFHFSERDALKGVKDVPRTYDEAYSDICSKIEESLAK